MGRLSVVGVRAPRSLRHAVSGFGPKMADLGGRGRGTSLVLKWSGALLPERGQDDGRRNRDEAHVSGRPTAISFRSSIPELLWSRSGRQALPHDQEGPRRV